MEQIVNQGFDLKTISDYRLRIGESGHLYLLDETDENNDECAHFFFVGKYDGQDVIYDAVVYTLRLQHQSELFDIAEHKAAQHFPQYRRIEYEEDENGNLQTLDDLEEEIGLYMAEVITELEEEDQVKVKEHLEIDSHIDFGIGIDAGLHEEQITPKIIDQFVRDFNNGKLALDETLYSFQTEEAS